MQELSNKLNITLQALQETFRKFKQNPSDYFYEEDIRAYLFYKLFAAFEKADIKVPLNSDEWFTEYTKNNIKINPVKAEYGNDGGYYSQYGISNLDIVILGNELIDGTNNFQRKCDIILEVKYSTESNNSKSTGFCSDYLKIKSAKKDSFVTGVALCFDLHQAVDEQKIIDFYYKYDWKLNRIEIKELELAENNTYAMYIGPNNDDHILVHK